ncbi:RNA dependent RNA polymerase-domain-containing protein [Lentinula edodes]|nr:RNA dependent RNA polymerase-domain-containing protein [Lentinula edodes]
MTNLKRGRPDSVADIGRPNKLSRLNANPPIVIINNDIFQQTMEQKRIPYGIQFELARTLASNPDSMSKFQNLISNLPQDQMPTHSYLFSQIFSVSSLRNLSTHEVASTAPWEELDKEEEAFAKDPLYAGIGNNEEYPGWWAGNIIFVGKLEETGEKIVLEKATLGPSNKIQRRFGSACILRVKIPSKRFYAKQNDLVLFFKRPVVIWNHVFRAFFAKDNTVFLFKTNEILLDKQISLNPSPHADDGLSLYEFIKWLNPLEYNSHQKLCKWASRLALGLSSSIPGPRLKQEEITYESDIILDASDPSSNMTDGCGISSLALHKVIHETYRERLQLSEVSTAIQFRLAGAKGMVLLANHDKVEDLQVILRSSQIKICYSSVLLDPSHLTMDILRFSHTKTPAKLSEEVIKNLHHNGVPASVFIGLLQQRLQQVVDGLTAWEGPDAMPKLWKAVEAAEGVIGARKARVSPTDSRVRGYGSYEDDEDDEEGMKHETSSQPWWADPFSGCPSSIAETVMELLDSGFTPLNSPYLRDKLKQCVKTKIKTAAAKFNYVLTQSCSAFAVPDPFGVLGPDQIYFKNSRREFVNKDGIKTDIILGEVLITRNPCKVPTDVRKVTAVQHPALADMVNVVVCSIQGHRRLIDYCGGGDFDGDRLLVIWDESFVKPFTNADEKYSKAPPGIESCFAMDKEGVAQFCSDMHKMGDQVEGGLQDHLLSSLRDPRYVGDYSRFHENAVYEYGYAHWRSINLAYKFCLVLDSAKTGYRIKSETYLSDRKLYSHPLGPSYKITEKKASNSSNDLPLQRGEGLPKFIMDSLHIEAAKQRDYWLIEVDNRFSNAPLNLRPDPDLVFPWQNFCNEARERSEKAIVSDLNVISDHVEAMYKQRVETYVNPASGSFTSQPITVRQDKIRDLSQRFISFPGPRNLKTLMEPTAVARLRASYAYIYAIRRGGPAAQFPFDRAFRELCAIKAQAVGGYKVCLQSMNDYRK